MKAPAKHEIDELKKLLESLKSIMISVSTGGAKPKDKNYEYVELKREAGFLLEKFELTDPNPYADIWNWHGKWTDGSLDSYPQRRQFVSDMYHELLKQLGNIGKSIPTDPEDEPTGWERVDRTWSRIKENMTEARNEEDFQAIGLQCREIMISVAQAVYDPKVHSSPDEKEPSNADTKRMIEAYLCFAWSGSSNKEIRQYVRTAYDLANSLQHGRNATEKDALICMEASRTIINLLKILNNSA